MRRPARRFPPSDRGAVAPAFGSGGDRNDEVGEDSDDDDVDIDYHDLQPQQEHHVGDQDCTHPQ